MWFRGEGVTGQRGGYEYTVQGYVTSAQKHLVMHSFYRRASTSGGKRIWTLRPPLLQTCNVEHGRILTCSRRSEKNLAGQSVLIAWCLHAATCVKGAREE